MPEALSLFFSLKGPVRTENRGNSKRNAKTELFLAFSGDFLEKRQMLVYNNHAYMPRA